jgi:hypothetical protein
VRIGIHEQPAATYSTYLSHVRISEARQLNIIDGIKRIEDNSDDVMLDLLAGGHNNCT